MNSADSRQLQLQAWLNGLDGIQCEQLKVISGDASFRRYFRFDNGDSSLIAVDAPPKFENAQRFCDVADSYRSLGIPVPAVLAVDVQQGFYCQQDLGDCLLATVLEPANCAVLYQQALALLPAIQQCTATQSGPLPAYDQALLDIEFHLFSHWLLEIHLGLELSEAEQHILQHTIVALTRNFFAQPTVGVHRDFHSRNLLLDSEQRLQAIDFQDAVIGPLTYDPVSLLRDCYQMWPDAQVYQLLQAFWQQHHQQYDWAEYKRWFDLTGMQRHIKASGIFARLWHRDGKSGYLADIPRTLAHLINVARQYPEFDEFAGLIEHRILPALREAA